MVLDLSLAIIHTQAGTPQISILDPGSRPHHSLLSSLLTLFNTRSLGRTLFALRGTTSQLVRFVFHKSKSKPCLNDCFLVAEIIIGWFQVLVRLIKLANPLAPSCLAALQVY